MDFTGRALLVLLLAIGASAAKLEKCRADAGLIYPHENDCSKYYVCLGLFQQELECSDGNSFSKDLKICVNPILSGCINKCQDGSLVEMSPVEGSCTEYSVCVLGHPTVLSCKDDWHFHPEWKICVPKVMSRCEEVVVERCSTPAYEPLPHPEDCGKFNVCIRGKTREFSCRRNWNFHAKWRVCVPPMLYRCGASVEPEGECANSKYYKHPTDCHKFFMCVMGKPREMTCGKNLHFHPKRICVAPFMSGCSAPVTTTTAAPTTEAPTTEAPTTTEEAATTTTTPKPVRDRCTTRCRTTHWKDESDCTSYFKCVDGKTTKFTCPNGLRFNPREKVCDIATQVVCRR